MSETPSHTAGGEDGGFGGGEDTKQSGVFAEGDSRSSSVNVLPGLAKPPV